MHAQLDAIGLVVDDMARSIAFYHELGFDFGDGAEHEPHVEASTPGGLRLLWDTVETSSPSTRSGGRPVADPGWPSPSSSTAQPTSMTPMRGLLGWATPVTRNLGTPSGASASPSCM